jgi:RNA polymerase sigma-70 factor, ECF subfamily
MHTDIGAHVVALRPLLVRLARRQLRNDAWAEDAVSATVIAALEKPGAFAGRATAKTWLVGILKHKLVDELRRNTRELPLVVRDDDDADAEDRATEHESPWGDPLESLAQAQFVALVDRCLAALPAPQRRAFVLREALGAETPEVCRELGVTANHLGVMLHRARRSLQRQLQAPALLRQLQAPGSREMAHA